MALLENLHWRDGEQYNPPENPLKEKWKEKYPRIKMPEFSQVCDGWSCLWCDRCPDGSEWKVPEEDKEEYEEYNKKFKEYINKHGGFGNLIMDINVEEYKKYLLEKSNNETETFSYDDEMVSGWMNDFKSLFVHMTEYNIIDEIDESKISLSNELIWRDGCTDEEQIGIHNQNIANLKEYINRLENLKK